MKNRETGIFIIGNSSMGREEKKKIVIGRLETYFEKYRELVAAK